MKETKKGAILIIGMVLSLTFFGCPKKPPKIEVKPEVPSAQPVVEEEPSIRGDEFVSVSELQPIYFDYDKFELNNAAKSVLEKNAVYLLSHPEYEVLIEGHCCECGTNEYNLALGQKRASVVRDYYINFGIPAGKIATISYGEEKPVNKNVAPPDNPKCIPNRRVETKVRLKK